MEALNIGLPFHFEQQIFYPSGAACSEGIMAPAKATIAHQIKQIRPRNGQLEVLFYE